MQITERRIFLAKGTAVTFLVNAKNSNTHSTVAGTERMKERMS